jgi:hypothetical protein
VNGYSSSGSVGSTGGLEKPNEGAGVTDAGFMGSSALVGDSVSDGLGLEAEGRMLGRLGGLVTAAGALGLAMALGLAGALAAIFFLAGALREAVFVAAFFFPAGRRAATFLFMPPLARAALPDLLFAGAFFFPLLDFADAFFLAGFFIAIVHLPKGLPAAL